MQEETFYILGIIPFIEKRGRVSKQAREERLNLSYFKVKQQSFIHDQPIKVAE